MHYIKDPKEDTYLAIDEEGQTIDENVIELLQLARKRIKNNVIRRLDASNEEEKDGITK